MKNFVNRSTFWAVLIVSFLLIGATTSHAQFSGKVLYITTGTAIGADSDKPVTDKLKEWGFTIEVVDVAQFKTASAPVPSVEDLKNYKLLFVSEFISSGDLARLRGATGTTWTTGWLPIPCVNTDNWASRVSALGFVPASSGYGSIDGNVVIVDQTNHSMSAGFAGGAEVSISSGTTSTTATDQNTYVIPDAKIKVIPIAASKQDNNKLVVFGIEKGTEVYNSAAVFGGATKTTARYAAVGIHQLAYTMITDDGWKFVKEAITWVLASGTDVENPESIPSEFALNQNYPNPFNPETVISYQLSVASYVTLKIYDILGNEVATLVDEVKAPGNYSEQFTASSKFASGVYFYKLTAGNFTAIKKMTFLK